MARIGIVTIHNSPNYGACIQSFALYEYLRQQGYDVEIVDLHRPSHSDYISSRHFKPYENRFETVLQKAKRIIKSTFFNRTKNETVIKRSAEPNTAEGKFNRFNSKIRHSCPYEGIDLLYKNPPSYDLLITGSDQVWNPTQQYCIEPYFLTFAPDTRKISYASSIGITELTRQEKKDFRKWLAKYDRISVREQSAQTILHELTGKNIHRVPDPTFLVKPEYWEELAEKPKFDGYVLVFTLSYNSQAVELGKKIASESGKIMISLNQNQPECHDSGYVAVTDAGPEEWLGYIENADMVITDSFHCTVFSIIFGTNFFTYIAPGNQRGSRIIDLLNLFGLHEHLIEYKGFANYTYSCLSEKKLCPGFVRERIEIHRNIGRKFLNDSI